MSYSLSAFCFTEVSVGGPYRVDLLPGFLVLGVAIPLAFVPIAIAALAGATPQGAGLLRATDDELRFMHDRPAGRDRGPLWRGNTRRVTPVRNVLILKAMVRPIG